LKKHLVVVVVFSLIQLNATLHLLDKSNEIQVY
jgi:hypothetical protein